ncbi:hypothetical protein J6590_059514 [Homalodisca vitripennis]|nr:hypothetical protein J6590_059514 [Homalodisca vitripennis]
MIPVDKIQIQVLARSRMTRTQVISKYSSLTYGRDPNNQDRPCQSDVRYCQGNRVSCRFKCHSRLILWCNIDEAGCLIVFAPSATTRLAAALHLAVKRCGTDTFMET